MLSALMITPLIFSAKRRAKDDLPIAVGPTIKKRVWFKLFQKLNCNP